MSAASASASLASLVSSHDLVVSLLPASMHVAVAELCLDRGKHFVSASYESPAMRGLDARAKQLGITLLNEMGLDPGIDHMSAMQVRTTQCATS
jgi:alpha-aminoadipic semialdehyde synthase